MGFLIKSAFWFTIVLLLLPFTNPRMESRLDSEPQVRIGATIVAATSALDDLTGICKRRPDVCETGGQTLAALAARARDGALIAYQFLGSRFADGNADRLTTATLPSSARDDVSLQKSASLAAKPEAVAASVPVPMPAPVEAVASQAPSPAPTHAAFLPKPYSPPRP